MMSYTVKDILKMEVAPALGCTEPVAIALGAAAAATLLPANHIDAIEIWVDPNIYKNGLAVSIPGTNGLTGLDTAAAIGALGGDAALKLEVLRTITDEVVAAARKILDAGNVKVNLLTDHKGIYIKTVLRSGSDRAESIIRDLHDNIVTLKLNDRDMTASDLLSKESGAGNKNGLQQLESWLKERSLSDLLEMVNDLDNEDKRFLEEGIRFNMQLAKHGLKHGQGLGVGKTLERLARQGLIKKDMILEARILASAAADSIFISK